MIFDTHTHYDDRAYGNSADELIRRILSTNVTGFIAVGANLKRSRASVKIAEKYSSVYASVGIHPHDVDSLPPDYLAQLEVMAKSSKVVAIGETGLDYHYEGYNREKQITVFREQLGLAQKLNLPVIIHSREAKEDTMNILRGMKNLPKAVMHCYSGDVAMARELLNLGILISFTGVITFKNAHNAVEVCREIPLESIMLETDCPYMAPVPFRGKLCDSSMLGYVAEKLAEIKDIPVSEVVRVCNDNAMRFFNI